MLPDGRLLSILSLRGLFGMLPGLFRPLAALFGALSAGRFA
jgi:hypothetical protein